ncbi:hypothetical protein Tco_0391147 [Tanacetum coccineum]
MSMSKTRNLSLLLNIYQEPDLMYTKSPPLLNPLQSQMPLYSQLEGTGSSVGTAEGSAEARCSSSSSSSSSFSTSSSSLSSSDDSLS